MGTKMAVSFADIFMAKIETEIINHCTKKPLVWKRYIDDVFSLNGTQAKKKLTPSLNKRTAITLQSNLHLKSLTKKLLF